MRREKKLKKTKTTLTILFRSAIAAFTGRCWPCFIRTSFFFEGFMFLFVRPNEALRYEPGGWGRGVRRRRRRRRRRKNFPICESIGHRPLRGCCPAPPLNYNHNLLKQGTGTADHLTLLRLFSSISLISCYIVRGLITKTYLLTLFFIECFWQ